MNPSISATFLLLTLWANPVFGRQAAILGDSLSTGAVTRTGIVFDETALMRHFKGETFLGPTPENRVTLEEAGYGAAADFKAPRRLVPSMSEMEGGLNWVVHNAVFRFGHYFFDQESFSWGNLINRRAGVPNDQILVAAEDGARAEHAVTQAGRLLDATGGELPDDVFILFTGNDLCGPTADHITSADDYASSLERSVLYLMHNGKPAKDGTTIWLVEPVPVMQLVHSPEIQEKKVAAHGKIMTCRELQSGQIAASQMPMESMEDMDWAFLMRFLPKGPGDLCPAVFRGTAGDLNLANRLHAYRSAMSAIPDKIDAQAGYRVRVVSQTASLLFEPEDIAEDCFHLSLRGQVKLAEIVRNGMKDSNLQSRR